MVKHIFANYQYNIMYYHNVVVVVVAAVEIVIIVIRVQKRSQQQVLKPGLANMVYTFFSYVH